MKKLLIADDSSSWRNYHKAAIEKNLNRYSFTTIKEEVLDGKKRKSLLMPKRESLKFLADSSFNS